MQKLSINSVRITLAEPTGIQLLFVVSLVMTFGVNHHDLVVEENVAARVYAIPEIIIPPMYISHKFSENHHSVP